MNVRRCKKHVIVRLHTPAAAWIDIDLRLFYCFFHCRNKVRTMEDGENSSGKDIQSAPLVKIPARNRGPGL
jgi:hypothetical protein